MSCDKHHIHKTYLSSSEPEVIENENCSELQVELQSPVKSLSQGASTVESSDEANEDDQDCVVIENEHKDAIQFSEDPKNDNDNSNRKEQDASNDIQQMPAKPQRKKLHSSSSGSSLSPAYIEKKLVLEKKRSEREEKKRIKEAEREERHRLKEEKQKLKQEKEELRLKEKKEKEERKRVEKEEKEQKRREREEKDEQKRKEKEQEKLKRQVELDEKNREKLKLEEQKQKTSAAFVSFFVPKKTPIKEERKLEEKLSKDTFMPFEVKPDMKLAPLSRASLTIDQKISLDHNLHEQNCSRLYLDELKGDKTVGRSYKTFPVADDDDDIMIIEDNALGESIVEQKGRMEKMRAKFLKFNENQRPPYFGSWRKKSKFVRAKRPFGRDDVFNYDVDSDEEWEEESVGESLKGTDDEDEKENDSDNEYEVDNECFVPHGYLSEDEIDDEECTKFSPEFHKAKLKLLKCEFDEEMKEQTQKIKPRVFGCIWYDKDKSSVEESIDRFFQPFTMITNGVVVITKRVLLDVSTPQRKAPKFLSKEHVPMFLKFIHGQVKKRKILVGEFLHFLEERGIDVNISKGALETQFKNFAQWMRCPEDGPMYNKMCWFVGDDIRKEYDVVLTLPNK